MNQDKFPAHEYINQVIEGECLQVLPHLPDQCVDLVLCDLPFGTTRNSWDNIIDMPKLWNAYYRITKPNAAIILFAQGIFTAELILSNREAFRYKIVWIKSKATNFLNRLKQPLRKHEDICVFYRQQPTYHPQMGRGKPYKVTRKGYSQSTYGRYAGHTSESAGDRYPTDIFLYEPVDFLYSVTCEHTHQGFYHSAQKPVDLGRCLIRMFSNPGDIVLDNACGSGSFLVAAVQEQRRFIGIELNKGITLNDQPADLIAICRQRLQATQSSLDL